MFYERDMTGNKLSIIIYCRLTFIDFFFEKLSMNSPKEM